MVVQAGTSEPAVFGGAAGIHLYSSQELSYVIYHYPLLVLDGFVGENLFTFLREELNHGSWR